MKRLLTPCSDIHPASPSRLMPRSRCRAIPLFVADAADAASAAGQDQKAESLLAEARRERPEDTFIQKEIAPRIEARSQIRHGKAAAAIQTLAAASPYENGLYFDNHLLRGGAYIASGQPANAVPEFRNILARRGLSVVSVAYPLAQLGLARALAAQHDTANARTAYQDFFALWKSADPDIPVLIDSQAGVREAAVSWAAGRAVLGWMGGTPVTTLHPSTLHPSPHLQGAGGTPALQTAIRTLGLPSDRL
jgi:predicted Zn-dependent protease